MPWSNLQTIALLRDFCTYSFGNSTNSQKLRSCGLIPLKNILIFLKNFLNFRLVKIEK